MEIEGKRPLNTSSFYMSASMPSIVKIMVSVDVAFPFEPYN
jgi:hypothetical protein